MEFKKLLNKQNNFILSKASSIYFDSQAHLQIDLTEIF